MGIEQAVNGAWTMVIDRRKSENGRELCELVLRRASLLEVGDRVLLEQVLGRGVKPRELAVIAEGSTRAIQRRVRGLAERLMDKRVEWVIRQHRRWAEPVRSVGLGVWVKGWTLRETTERLGLTLHQVRTALTELRGMMRQAQRGERARGAWREEAEFAMNALRRAKRVMASEGMRGEM